MAAHIPSFRAAALSALIGLLVTGELALAREVVLPLRFDNALVEKVLVDQLFTGPAQSLVAMKDGSGCNYLLLSDPQLNGADGLLRIRSAARGRVATTICTQCLVFLDWTGFVETDQRAELDGRNPRVQFRTVDSRLLDDDGEPSMIAGALWGWVSDHVHPRLDTLTIDLQAPLAEIQALLPLMLTSGDAERTRHIIDSLSLTAVSVERDALTLAARVDIPDLPQQAVLSPQTVLTP